MKYASRRLALYRDYCTQMMDVMFLIRGQGCGWSVPDYNQVWSTAQQWVSMYPEVPNEDLFETMCHQMGWTNDEGKQVLSCIMAWCPKKNAEQYQEAMRGRPVV